MERFPPRLSPASTFETFEPQTENQQRALENMRGLAHSLIGKMRKASEPPPCLDVAKMLFLHSAPGRGKTHLAEAFIAEIVTKVPSLQKYISWIPGRDIYTALCVYGHNLESERIIVIDDLFDNLHRVEDMGDREVQALLDLVMRAYAAKNLILITCNFPITKEILPKVGKVDVVGRAASRFRHILANSGEIGLDGADYREVLASKSSDADFFKL